MEDKINGGTVSVSNEGKGGTFSFYDNSLDGWCVLHISTKTGTEYNTLKQVLIDNPEVIFSKYVDVDKDFLIENIDGDLEITLNENMYGYYGDSTSAIEQLKQLEELCGFKFGYREIFAGKRVRYNFIIEKNYENEYPYPRTGQWYELYDDCEVYDYWAIIDCIEDGDVYLAERSTLNNVCVTVSNKKTGEEIGSCPVMIETDATDDEVYEKLRDNDFYLTFLGIPIADSIEKLNAMEWRQDFYDYLQNDPSSFLSDLSNEDFDVDGLTVDDLSFEVK